MRGGGVTQRVSGKESFLVESNGCFNELTEGVEEIEVGTSTWTLETFQRVTSQAWPHWQNKEDAVI